MQEVNHRELVRRAAAGDGEAFAELVARYRDAVYGICYHRIGQTEEAKDLAQEAFVRAYLDLSQLRDPTAFPAWLRRVAERVCATWQRRRRLQTTSLESTPEPETYADLDLPLAIRQALSKLSDDARLAVTLYYVNGYTTREVGEFLGVPTGTVKSRLHHARRRLKEELMEEYRETLKQSAPGPEFEGAVVRAVRSLEEARRLPGAHRFKRLESPQDLDHFLVLEKDGTILGECWHDIQEMRIRGVTVQVARAGYTTGESVGDGTPEEAGGIHDRLAVAALANLAESGFPLAATHEIMLTATRVGYVPCYYHYRIRVPALNLARGDAPGSVREYRNDDAGAVSQLRKMERSRPEMWAWQGPGERPAYVLERDGQVVGCYSLTPRHPQVEDTVSLLNEMEGADAAAYRSLCSHWAGQAVAEGAEMLTTYLSPQHPAGSLILACDGECRMQGTSWNVAKDEEHIAVLDLVGALRAVAPGLGRPSEGRASIEMDGQVATIVAADPPRIDAGAPKGAKPSRIGRVSMPQLLVGYRSVFELAGRPDVAIRDADLAILDSLLPKIWPYSWPDPYIWDEECFRRSRPWAFEEPWLSRLGAWPRPWA